MLSQLIDLLILAEDAPQQEIPPWVQWAPFVAMAVFFYFILIRPQKQERNRQQQLRDSLKKNDVIVTIGGIIGTIADAHPARVIGRTSFGAKRVIDVLVGDPLPRIC